MNEEGSIQGLQDEQAYRVAYLLSGYIQNRLTDQEHIELDTWVNESFNNQRMFEQYTDPKNIHEWLKWKEQLDTVQALDRVKYKLGFNSSVKKQQVRFFWSYAAAAAILLALTIFFVFTKRMRKSPEENLVQHMEKDISPGGNHARLQLADGTVIDLDKVQTGKLSSSNDISIHKEDSGLLLYQRAIPLSVTNEEEYNTLTVPAGGQYKIQLADGSMVWLNAGSSLRYPVAFLGKTRKVILTGEAYFEVAKDPMFPFEVKANNTTVRVLGTHFNINAYSNEPAVKITLEEGSVKVNDKITLQPGQQATVNNSGNIQATIADMETELAWKNNLFIFKHASIDVIMRQIERWYHCEVLFKTVIQDNFNASIPRNVPVSTLLHYLEGTGMVHFTIEKNIITVLK